MYALPNKTQHKLIVKVRGGISQKLDNFTSTSSNSKSGSISSAVRNKNFSSPSSSSPFNSEPINSNESALSKHIDEVGFGAELNNLPQPIFYSTTEKNGNKSKSSTQFNRASKQQYITPEHNAMIKFVQQSWKGVERDYKKSVNNYINNVDLNNSSDHLSSTNLKQKQSVVKKKTATTSTPLLLSGSYHHTSVAKDAANNGGRQDSFQPFDLDAFWGNRILKRLTEDS
uniref:Protein FAM195A n=1 Tax=Aceria tosichella TaxID=561515 RepID=A0A6G1SFY8_9ACAR